MGLTEGPADIERQPEQLLAQFGGKKVLQALNPLVAKCKWNDSVELWLYPSVGGTQIQSRFSAPSQGLLNIAN
jgi:hypothetical protein